LSYGRIYRSVRLLIYAAFRPPVNQISRVAPAAPVSLER